MKIEFEWDEQKNQANVEKHGVSFEQIANCLASKPYIIRASKNNGNDNLRFQAVTQLDDKYYTIIYTLRDAKVRIISARRARENEKREFNNIFS